MEYKSITAALRVVEETIYIAVRVNIDRAVDGATDAVTRSIFDDVTVGINTFGRLYVATDNAIDAAVNEAINREQ